MIINGFQKVTLLDYPGKIACMIFTSGCNFMCSYCQNSSLIKKGKVSLISEEEIIDYLKKRKNLIDGIVISGGEPTVQIGLIDFIKKIKELKVQIKLDTNGYRPDVLKELLENNLIDYVAMDIKNTFDDYPKLCGLKSVDANLIKKSINILKNSNVDYEFRTTIIKEHHTIDKIKEIIKLIGDSKYFLQNFESSADVMDKSLTSFSEDELNLIKKELVNYSNVTVRGL
ncbi:MAG: anaerobic ribonucleoside-triphosphate reductase activating protein [Bacilli bacterium]|nr:anaerobic ribonucleoside-triphosphate reductase activating protein [Bacilli bacterium]